MKRLLWLAIIFGVTLPAGQLADGARRGDALFTGKETMQGTIRGHDNPLSAEVVRCVNCHGPSKRALVSRLAAPRIDRPLLLEPRQRRGGPPSRYDQASFCKLLRTGADPAYILIAREMPIYQVDDGQCASLWSYVIGKESADAKR